MVGSASPDGSSTRLLTASSRDLDSSQQRQIEGSWDQAGVALAMLTVPGGSGSSGTAWYSSVSGESRPVEQGEQQQTMLLIRTSRAGPVGSMGPMMMNVAAIPNTVNTGAMEQNVVYRDSILDILL